MSPHKKKKKVDIMIWNLFGKYTTENMYAYRKYTEMIQNSHEIYKILNEHLENIVKNIYRTKFTVYF
jgi:uncharacterized lipoprotein YajG